ncbi:uncharacterized protein FIESC28_04052 [Fusarium coffeatum]|uniref:CID domain-containing protein n=1 Tax=Fusarium coffeatum TaxID=231269 RepID=A0A366S148_9HYPO|nr:uncharacterized protein FIESC28_04052 [Fusarium coffeatum]RBR23057.1 hypothetical protein FIESC28_04052 [Fusarium coffeatum]
MATPELAIAKATLSATLFRADPTSLSRPSVEAFFSLLTDALAQCSRPNVQKCKVWIVENVAPSTARTTALAKYLGALSKSLQDDGSRPSLKRRRLHLLYVLNDVFHHFVARKGDVQFAMLWEKVLPSLIASAAAFNNCPKHKKKLADLIQIWLEKQYLRPNVIIQLEDALASGVAPQTEEPQVSNASIKLAKDAPFTLPSFHGDHSVPWYDLPATTWLPHLTPNSTKAMYPDQIRPIQLASGPADKVLVTAVQDLLGEVERMFSKEQKWDDDNDLNELGERVVLDEITGDIIGGHVATLEVDHEALHDLRINVQESETREVEVPRIAGVDHTAAVNAVDVVAQATAEVAVEAGDDHTADHLRAHLHDSKKLKIDHVHLQSLNSRHKVISLRFLHQVISHYHLRLQWAIKDLGHHRLLHTWHKVGFLLTLP